MARGSGGGGRAARAHRRWRQARPGAASNGDNNPSPLQLVHSLIRPGLLSIAKKTKTWRITTTHHLFVLSLISNPSEPETDIGLEVTINFRDRSVVRNAKVSGKWGKEEKNIPYFPFTPMQHFKMEILCEHQQFRVQVDGQQLFDFTHRVQQLQKLTALKITGDVRLTKVV
ncbi:galectin-related protein A-like isoform X1 [Heterodontus francisci]|uniref:galectin-related protein A-like isoform X1 n=1 Tax=Heterodontus francisci TaxID=7792 RepID=UPI00355C42E9